jgi:hypothetical protein
MKREKEYSGAPRRTYSSCTASNTVQRRDRWGGMADSYAWLRVFLLQRKFITHTQKNDYSFFRCLNAHIRYFNVRETTVSMGRLSCTSVVTRNVWSGGSHIGIALLGIKILVNNQLDAQFFFSYIFISILYTFRAPLCSSSGGSIVLTL